MNAPQSSPPDQNSARPVYFFFHIPKCAGSTVKNHLAKIAPDRTIRAKRRRGFMRDFGGDYSDFDRTAINAETVDFVAGHSLSRSLSRAFPGRPIQPFVLIRDPLSFAVSFYNHRNRNAAREGRGPVPFELYIKSLPKNPLSRFFLTRYLGIGYPKILQYDSRQRFELVDNALHDFWYVASWLHVSELVDRLSDEMQTETAMDIRNAASGDTLRPDKVPAETAEHVRLANASDQALFERWGDVRWSGEPRDIDIDLPTGDQSRYIGNEIGRQVMSRYIKMFRPRLAG